jgi:hypothetical protein
MMPKWHCTVLGKYENPIHWGWHLTGTSSPPAFARCQVSRMHQPAALGCFKWGTSWKKQEKTRLHTT